MSDDHERRLADIEKRLARLERMLEKPVVRLPWLEPWAADAFVKASEVHGRGAQWCDCGRDVCRAPDCPSHKHDPLGR